MDTNEKKNAEGEIVLYQPDATISMNVLLDTKLETVWLTQEQIAQLFGTQRPAITKHLAKIYQTGELTKETTCSILEHMGNKLMTVHSLNAKLSAIMLMGISSNVIMKEIL